MTFKTLAFLGVALVIVCGVIGLYNIEKNTNGNSELAAVASYATTTNWPPTWLSSANLPSASAWQNFSTDSNLHCNSSSFATDPILGNLYIGRRQNDSGCTATSFWSLVWASMDWKSATMKYEHPLLDTSHGSVAIGDGHSIVSAYDPTFMWWNGTGWVAFECYYGGSGVGSCLGPLKNDMTLDLARTALVITGASSSGYNYSASVPKLMVYQSKPYIYWSVVQIQSSNNQFLKITGRGALLGQESSGAKRLFPVFGTSQPQAIAANDARATDVTGVSITSAPPDPVDADLDIFQVLTDGSSIFTTSGRAGGTCVTPAGTTSGCYRLTLGRSTSPLASLGFNKTLIPDKYLPLNPQEYTRFVYRPTDGKTVLLAPHFTSTKAMPDVIYGTKYFVWGDNLFPNPILDTVAPSISITAPTANATSSRTVTITGSASDNVGVVGVQFKIDGQNFGSEQYAAPFTVSWDSTSATDGTHTLQAVVRDGTGRRATSTVSINTRNTPKTKSAFVNDLYVCILMRSADSAGYNTYMSAPSSKKLPTFFTDFFGSAEYVNKKTTNDTYVRQLYRCVFYREGDPAGITTWINALSSGKTRSDVLNSFLSSSEFQTYVGPRLQTATGWPYK